MLQRGTRRLLLIAALALVTGCEGERAQQVRAPLDRAETLGPFLADYWKLPLEPQGAPPAGFTDGERSLDPAICGACHPLQYAQWQTSLHAAAYSPGLAGQLIEGSLSHPAQVRNCASCHTPLAEQQRYGASLEPNPGFDPELQARGLVCAGCHVRAHQRFGPEPRPAAPRMDRPPHGGFEVRAEFRESRFCAECHQFFGDPGVNGKPIENTYVEWLNSPQAAAGRQCQDCHMPDRAHLFRGIHDPDMVRSAVDVALVPYDDPAVGEPLAALVLRNRDVGHAFPTYLTPRVFLSIEQVDAGQAVIEGTRIEEFVGRDVDLGARIERADTRVLPGESVKLDYAISPATNAAELVARVVVDPDFHYRSLYRFLLQSLRDPKALELIESASRRISESPYELIEIRRRITNGQIVP